MNVSETKGKEQACCGSTGKKCKKCTMAIAFATVGIVVIALMFVFKFTRNNEGLITMTLQPDGEVSIYLAGTGTATIDWGDGNVSSNENLTEYIEDDADRDIYKYSHTFNTSAICTITIKGKKITMLSCSHINLKSLDVSKNSALEILVCSRNQLTSLDVSNNADLIVLGCYDNQLKSLDVSKNTALKLLDCASNQLINLDISKNLALKGLVCPRNQLTTLDISNNIELTRLYCSDNHLTNLDVSNNAALTELRCSNNQLTNLDVSNNIALIVLVSENNQLSDTALNNLFSSLHDFNNELEKDISISGNPGSFECDTTIAEDKGWNVYFE